MHASKTVRSKPNKQIKNRVAYSLQILSFIFKTWELIRRDTERLKTMLASPVAALRTCVILVNMTLAVMLLTIATAIHAKCKPEQHKKYIY